MNRSKDQSGIPDQDYLLLFEEATYCLTRLAHMSENVFVSMLMAQDGINKGLPYNATSKDALCAYYQNIEAVLEFVAQTHRSITYLSGVARGLGHLESHGVVDGKNAIAIHLTEKGAKSMEAFPNEM